MKRQVKPLPARTSTLRKDHIFAWFGSVLLIASCSAEPVHYQTIEEIAAALADAGYECTSGEVEVQEGTLGTFGCQWPTEIAARYPEDFLLVTLFESELARVQYLLGVLVWCSAYPEPPSTVSYAYDLAWTVFSGDCQGSIEDISAIATAIGGQANEFELNAYETFDFERPFEDWSTNELKDFLGEPVTNSTETAAATGENARSSLVPVEPVVDTDAPDVGAAAREAGWEVVGWPEVYETNDVLATDRGYLAVGSTGFRAGVWTSEDGTKWGSLHYGQEALDTGRILAIAESGFGLVAVGENADYEATSWLSTNGTSWERFDGAFGQFTVSDVSAGPSGVVVVGQSTDGRVDILDSGDGRSWSSQRVALERRLEVAGKLASANDGDGPLVLIGTDPYPYFPDEFLGAYRGLVWSSPDGFTWERVEAQELSDVDPTAIAWGPDGFVLIGQQGDSVVSSISVDGVSWTEAGIVTSQPSSTDPPPSFLVATVVWSGSDWIAGGSRNGETWAAYRSADGVSWTEVTLPSIPGGISGLASGPHGLVAVGDTEGPEQRDSGSEATDLIVHSPDGITWSVVAGDHEGALATAGFLDVAASDEALFAVGVDGDIWTSSNGRAWDLLGEPAALAEESLDQLQWWSDHFFVIANGEVWSSPDAIDWVLTLDPRATNDAGLVVRLFATQSRLYAVGLVGDSGAIWVSDDGADWRRVPEDSSYFPVPIVAIAENPTGEVVAVGEYGADVWTSADGSTWTRREQPEPLLGDFPNSPALIGTDSGWVMVGARTDEVDYRGIPAAWTSSDGARWTLADVESASDGGWMDAVTEYAGGLVAGGSEGLWHSQDGRTWEKLVVTPVESAWDVDLLVWNDQVIAVGGYGLPIVWLGPTASR